VKVLNVHCLSFIESAVSKLSAGDRIREPSSNEREGSGDDPGHCTRYGQHQVADGLAEDVPGP
jgi:hypothetical protein